MTNDEPTPSDTSELDPLQAACIKLHAVRSQEREAEMNAPGLPRASSETPRSRGIVAEALRSYGAATGALAEQGCEPFADAHPGGMLPPSPSVVEPAKVPEKPPRSERQYSLPEPTLPLPLDIRRRLADHGSRDFANMPRHVWLVRDVFHGGEVITLWGESQAGKTVLLLNLVAAIARGLSWADHPVIQTNVVYVAQEAQIGVRQRVLALEHDLGTGPLEGVHYVFEPCNIAIEEDVNALALTALLRKAKFIVIDTLSASMAGKADENSNSAMAGVIANVQHLAQMTGAAVLLVHHTGNDPSRGARGAYALHANPDVSIEVGRRGDEHFWRLVKGRDGRPNTGGKFRIEPITFQTEQDDEPQESIVVRHQLGEGALTVSPSSSRKTKAELRALEALGAIRECLLAEIVSAGHPATHGMTYDEACQVVTAKFKDYGSNHRAEYVRDAMSSLIAAGRLVRVGDTIKLPQ